MINQNPKMYRYFEVIDYSNKQYGVYDNMNQANIRVNQLRENPKFNDKRFMVNPFVGLKRNTNKVN